MNEGIENQDYPSPEEIDPDLPEKLWRACLEELSSTPGIPRAFGYLGNVNKFKKPFKRACRRVLRGEKG